MKSALVRAAVVSMALGAPVAALAQGGTTFTVTNQSAWTIHHLYISASDLSSWGDDQLGTDVVITGASYTISGIPCNTYDLKIVDEDGDSCVMNRIPMCGAASSYTITSDNLLACISGATTAPAAAATFQQPRPAQPIAPTAPGASVTVYNTSSWSIHRLYLSSASVSTWGDDRLGEGTIPTGSSHTLYSIACDTYDVKLVDEDGDECQIRGVRLCGESQTWTITNDNLLACQAGN